MYIIGHRGARGLELENTIASLKKAVDIGVDAVEFDVHKTLDDQIVLSHNGNLRRTGGGDHNIAELALSELRTLPLRNGRPVPILSEALTAVGSTPVIIEIKSKATVELVLSILDQFPHLQATIASPIYDEIKRLKELRPDVPGFIREFINPFEALATAKSIKADGVDLNLWILNPLTYYMARRLKMDIMVYVVNYRFLAKFIRLLYPTVQICTDYPDRFVKRRKLSDKIAKTA